MSASISDPFILSTYDVSDRFAQSEGRPNVFVTHQSALGGREGYAAVTAHGDGVHILDVSNLHLVCSHTLGPSTSFACPAVTRTITEGGVKLRKTYAAIKSSPELAPHESGKVIWLWTENASGESSSRSQEKKVVVLSHEVSRIYPLDDPTTSLLLISSHGDLTVVDGELNIRYTQSAPAPDASLMKSFTFARESCYFISGNASAQSALVLFSHVGNSIRLSVYAVGADGADKILEESLPLEELSITDISCSESGYISVLDRRGLWSTFRIELESGSLRVRPTPSTLHLANLRPITPVPQPLTDRSSAELSLLSLGTSHVLLASIPSHTSEICLLLWDLAYSVLLASHSFAIPSSASFNSKEGISVELVYATSTQALLALSPKTSKTASASASRPKSTILIVPYTSPAVSTIANAMGRADSAKKWLAKPATASTTKPVHTGLDAARTNVLKTMRAAVEQNRQEAADGAFFEWAGKEEKAQRATKVSLGHEFVRQLLDIVIQPSKPIVPNYSPIVLWHLLQCRVVSSNMVEGGLIPVLLSRKDWASVLMAIDNVIDIPEADLISVLKLAVNTHRRQRSGDAMQIDSSEREVPSISSVLASCVRCPSSPAALRAAIHSQLSDAEDICCVLEVLDEWLVALSSTDISLLPTDVSKSAQEVLEGAVSPNLLDIPPLDKILAFLRTTLDASFLSLLQLSSSHALLKRISSHLEPELALIDQAEQLRGPLEPFAKAQAKFVAEAAQGDVKKDSAQQGDWRRRRKLQHEQAGLAIGLYQVEELVL